MKTCIICELEDGEKVMPSLDIRICPTCLELTKNEDIVLCFNCRSRYGFKRTDNIMDKIVMSGLLLEHLVTKHGGKVILSMFCPECKEVRGVK
jgi:hypothetical protein